MVQEIQKKQSFKICKRRVFKTEEKEKSDQELDENEFFKYFENKSEGISYEFFERHFNNVIHYNFCETEIEKPDKILKVVQEILHFNKKFKKNQDMD